MWTPIARDAATVANAATFALVQPADVGDKQPVYLLLAAPTTAYSLGIAGGAAGTGFVVGIGETWMAGPILGEDLENWGLFAAVPLADADVIMVSARLNVDPRPAAISIHDTPAKTPLLDFIWDQLV